MNFKLVVTYSDDKVEVFKRLLNSLKAQADNIFMVCVYQGEQPVEEHENMISQYIEGSFVLLKSHRCSLSEARNKGLKYIYDNYALCPDDVVMFPDDDCWYENGFFERVTGLNWKENDFYSFRVFDPIERKEFGKRKSNISVSLNYLNAFRLPISVGLAVNFKLFRDKVEYFNEELGIGTDIGSGEETEVVLKLLHAKCKGEYNGFLNVYHEIYKVDDNFIVKTGKYAIGQGYCLKMFAMKFSPLIWLTFIELLLRSAVGYLVTSKKLSQMYKVRFISLFKGIFIKLD
ncbi:glycosyltransferase family A protein [Vibrio cyclitrophicus]|nr:glycosyltransferase family A protein [Vibrio cyclitrophicus]PME46501.1 hypothetical protein BCV35_16565 [Vibrio cyclitrophicus]